MDAAHVVRFLAVAAVLATGAGCASFSGSSLVPGKSTAREVRAVMGEPHDRIEGADRSATWFYSRQPEGRQTFAVRLSAEGVLRDITPVLTYANVASLVPGKTTRDQVRAALGPPYRIDRMSRQQQDAWGYRMVLDAVPMHVWVLLSDDGIVRDVVKSEDLPLDRERER